MTDTTTSADVKPDATPRTIVLTVLGVTALLAVMLIAFALPSANVGANHVPVGVVGASVQVEALKAKADGLELTTYADAASARTAILERDEYGAIVLNPDGSVDTLVASAASTSVAAMVEQLGSSVATANGATANVTDVRSFPADDPRGAGLAAGALPLALGGWIGAVVIMLIIHTPGRRMIAVAAFAVVGGLGITATLKYGIGTIDDNFLLTSLGAMLGIAATAATVLGLRTLLGGIGLGVAGVLLMLLGNPLSGLTSAPEMLPSPWGSIGQLLPPGATGSLIRDLAFFDGHGTLQPIVVLLCWLVGGVVLYAAGVFKDRPFTDPERSEHLIEEAFEGERV